MSEVLDLRSNIKTDGYSPVPINLSRSDLNEAMYAYNQFLKLAEEDFEKTKFYASDRGDGDFGQFSRIAGTEAERGEVPDNKDIFHFGALTRQVVESRFKGETPKEVQDFLNAAEYIFWEAQRAKNNTLRQLDFNQMGLLEIMSPEMATINDVLRFINYYKNEDALAKGHIDRGVSTLAIGESHPGLRIAPAQNGLYLDCNDEYMQMIESTLTPAEYIEHEAKFFLGAGWNRLPVKYRLGNVELPLAYHDVTKSEITVDEEVMRWAIVMFSNPHLGFENYTVPTPPETRPYKQLGRLSTHSLVAA